jgi:hypothetical protein
MTQILSKYKVMNSAAGWYIGKECYDSATPELVEPYSRCSYYYPEKDDAMALLDNINQVDTKHLIDFAIRNGIAYLLQELQEKERDKHKVPDNIKSEVIEHKLTTSEEL